MNRRRGYTLIELTVSMPAGTAVLFLAIALVHQSMSLESKTRARASSSRSISRLTQAFRDDAHHAISMQVEGQKATFVRSDGSLTTYQIDKCRVTRVEHYPDDTSEDLQRLSPLTETYSFQDDKQVSLVEKDGFASLIVDRRAASPSDKSNTEWVVEAKLGKWAAIAAGLHRSNSTREIQSSPEEKP
jgi:type II secretory pathway pseudopilin PulG